MTKGNLNNKRVTVAGLGRFGGGIAAAKWLAGQGAKVLVTDLADKASLADSIAQLAGLPIEYRVGGHHIDDFRNCDLVVASPAIPPANEYLLAARDGGVPVTTEICLFVERCPVEIIAVSGTKGKSTTTKLLSLMLEEKKKVWLGGNIGRSLLFDLPMMRDDEVALLEVSSYMLTYLGEIGFAPKVGLLTMLGSDHLSWHGSQQAYLQAKLKLIDHQDADDHAVLNERCDIARNFAKHTRAKTKWYGMNDKSRFELKLPGEHNQLNAQAAFAAADNAGDGWGAAVGGDLSKKLHLHARSLAIQHPVTKALLTFTAPLPEHMARTWKLLDWKETDVPADPFAAIR